MDRSELGFIEFTVSVEERAVLDVVNTDHLNLYGKLKGNTYAARYIL